ncbi:MAG: LysR family transcriptional regulator [Rhizobiaceae bacterium]
MNTQNRPRPAPERSGGDTASQISRKVNIALLQTFHLVARSGSFSAAARELGISYQSAANHVRRLEQIYRVRLVVPEQGAKRISLTAQGKALYDSLGSELDIILSRIGLLLRDVGSVLRVGVPQALFHHFFPRITADFRAASPETSLEFCERDATLEQMMADGGLDVAVSERNFSTSIVTQHLLGAYRLALIHPRSWQMDPETDDLAALHAERDFITYESGQVIRIRAMELLRQRTGEEPRIAVSTSGSTSIAELVGSGIGYAIVPEWCVSPNDTRIVRRVLDDIEPIKVWFAHAAFLAGNPHVRHLLRCCREAISLETPG